MAMRLYYILDLQGFENLEGLFFFQTYNPTILNEPKKNGGETQFTTAESNLRLRNGTQPRSMPFRSRFFYFAAVFLISHSYHRIPRWFFSVRGGTIAFRSGFSRFAVVGSNPGWFFAFRTCREQSAFYLSNIGTSC